MKFDQPRAAPAPDHQIYTLTNWLKTNRQ